MCHAIITFHRDVTYCLIIFLFVSAITSLSSVSSTSKIFLHIVHMPVVTRSMTKGGLQGEATSAPPPLHHPTCYNAISDTLNNVILEDASIQLLSLPELIDQSNNTPSLSEHDSLSASTSDKDFETSEFENSKFLFTLSLLPGSISNSSQFSLMEPECEEEHVSSASKPSATPNDEILKILTAISSQMVVGQQDLQNQLISSSTFLKNELQKVREETKKFKLEMQAELNATSSPVNAHVSSVLPNVLSSPSLTTLMLSTGGNSTSSSSADFQSPMLAVLNDTFTKLSSVISDTSTILQDTKSAISDSKSSESKTEWSKFSGDPKKFHAWYLALMAQLSIAPWQSLYDKSTKSVITSTLNNALNGRLYAKVIGSLEGSALQHMLARKHL